VVRAVLAIALWLVAGSPTQAQEKKKPAQPTPTVANKNSAAFLIDRLKK
jgi:hypothetical protein